MKCPVCDASNLAVLEKRDIEEGVRRRRLCQDCGHRFTTYERSEVPLITVVKRGGQREHYDEDKVVRGIKMACKNRPVQKEQISNAAHAVTRSLREGDTDVVSSNQVGDLVLDHLRHLDHIAYLRFVSVHRSFPDIASFKREIQRLEKANQ